MKSVPSGRSGDASHTVSGRLEHADGLPSAARDADRVRPPGDEAGPVPPPGESVRVGAVPSPGGAVAGRVPSLGVAAALGRESQNTLSPEESKEVGGLPGGWRMARVGDILKVRSGYAFKSTDYKSEGVPLIRQSDLGDDVVDLAEAKRVDAHFLNELPGFVVRDGDLLIGMSGSLGKIARYQYREPALQNQRTGLLQVKPGHEPRFAKLVLKFVEPQILAEGKGIAVQNVSAKEIEDCTFPLPSSNEQRRIVAEVERRLSVVEELEAVVSANLQRAGRLRQSILQKAFTGQLA